MNYSKPRLARVLGAATALAATAGLLTACGTSDDEASAASGDGAFPVTIEHALGAATIPERPERVVTIGWMTQDIVAALGVVPVGVPETWGGDDEGFTPWFREHVTEELDAPLPEILSFDDAGDPDLEQVLALEPDVILAPHSGITDVQYDRLSEIAPTVAYAEEPWFSGSWDDLVLEVGTALGRDAEAEALVSATSALIDDAAADAGLEGTTVAYGGIVADGDTELGIYRSEDPRVAFLREFGLVDTPSLEILGEGFSNFVGALSIEELDTFETDLFVGWSNGPAETQATLANPVVSRWAPFAEGTYYFIEDNALAMATNAPTPLSIPWALERGFVDDLVAAAAGEGVVRAAD
ncbi:iron complex transport system substrate-binding protein [Nocardioides zeae]|uniref:Iron complex transport system substrate-binding protein n=2 Tax=Nocardioides zeae TaxID=1457234 RepID=A0AAJ1U640_9ACTN|nr:ABC transporter substrate-binding protein [Nocardioides zeae]MDQ1105191.1 iron complex transport system substrate-binding protein [Nocardioides zeae]MDR6175094.1 iron complex transport system substrate-binding protein [Nocardioides zeae]MDR6211672.1 iron complex transport system substrate-binding protein [Nocardioides zeae]